MCADKPESSALEALPAKRFPERFLHMRWSMTILFPSGYGNSRRADESFEREYEAAQEAGLAVALFHQQLWDGNREIRLCGEVSERVLYRGWMMKPEEYRSFYEKLSEKGLTLLTAPAQYEAMHIFPNVYKALEGYTPRTLFFPLHARMDVEEIRGKLGAFMIKDYVKSAKNTDFPTYFDRNVTQEEFERWMECFYEIRGELLTGGIQAKQYVRLKKYGGHTNEYRVFYLRGQILSVSRNSSQPLYVAGLPRELAEAFSDTFSEPGQRQPVLLPGSFYTVDFAEREDGEWIVIEAGDGGVSGLSEGQDYTAFYRSIKAVLA